MNDNEIKNILYSKYEEGKTRLNYLNRLSKLQSLTQNISIFETILNVDSTYDLVQKHYPNISTRKNFITLILSLFKQSPDLQKTVPNEIIVKWKSIHEDLNSFQEAKYNKNTPSPKQIEKYVTFNDIEKKYKNLKDPHNNRLLSQQYIFFSMIISQPPKRSDFSSMKVYYNRDPSKTGENYLVLHSSDIPSYMVFTKYKTSGHHMRVDQELSRECEKDIKDSLRRHPREYLFVNKFGQPYASNNAFTKFVIRTFENHFGTKTGVTMLRHIYITEKVDFNESGEVLEDIAHQMLHSTSVQKKYNWSVPKV